MPGSTNRKDPRRVVAARVYFFTCYASKMRQCQRFRSDKKKSDYGSSVEHPANFIIDEYLQISYFLSFDLQISYFLSMNKTKHTHRWHQVWSLWVEFSSFYHWRLEVNPWSGESPSLNDTNDHLNKDYMHLEKAWTETTAALGVDCEFFIFITIELFFILQTDHAVIHL